MTRGQRNHNLLNIRRSSDHFQGEVVSHDSSFKQFENNAYGYRAGFRILNTYINKRGCNTIESIINRYAPSSENNTENYIKAVEDKSGINRNKELVSEDKDSMIKIVAAMSFVENGVEANMNEIKDGWEMQ